MPATGWFTRVEGGRLVGIVETLAGRYRLIEPLGAGGMSVVWRGYDEVLGRQVAVKVLAARFAGDADFRARVRREAQAAARLSDPHITNVYDYAEAADGTPYVVMELVEGESLAAALARGPLPWPAVVEIGAQVAGALAVAHARGLVHRDVTPANIMLSPAGVKVVDFGISAVAGERGGPVIGTPAYLAPEQLAGAPAQPATDVYALGLVLSRALAPDARPPAALTAVLTHCLADDPARRPVSAEVARRLGALVPRPGGARVPVGTRTAVLPAVRVGHSGTRIMPPSLPVPPVSPPRRRRWPLVATVVALLLLCFAAGAIWAGHRGRGTTAAALPPASQSPSPTPSPPPALTCQIGYQLTDLKVLGYSAKVTIKNVGGERVAGWTLAFDLPAGQRLKTGWGGEWAQNGQRITVRDWVVNGTVDPGKSVDIGFYGTYKNKLDKPAHFSLNDVACGQSDE
jgi:serine/threonine-protein kinase